MNSRGMLLGLALGAAMATKSAPIMIAVKDEPPSLYYTPRVAKKRRAIPPAFTHDDSRQQRRARARADMKRLP